MTAQAVASRKPKFDVGQIVTWFLPAIILCIIAVMALVEPRFFSRLNTFNIMRHFTVTALLALAQGLVMIVGGFDLSIGAIMAAGSVVAALSMLAATDLFYSQPMLIISIGFAFALLMGALAGVVNGVLAAKLRASPFIITLGTMTVISGLTYWYTKGAPIYGMPDELVSGIGRGLLFNVPVIFWFGLVVMAVLWWVATQTRFGRHMYAVGSNPTAAHETGINPTRVLVVIYGISGMLAAAAGLILTARLGSGQSGIGGDAAIQSIAAAVIGGVSLRGGIGSIPRIAMAALFLALLSNALNLAQIDSKFQTLVLGAFLIAFVAIERKFDRNV
jgi:ribose transport system permease protein